MNTTRQSRFVSSIFIGRWTPKILFSLRNKPYRHGQLRRQLGNVSQRMLTRTLRKLESAGLIARHVTQSKAITVEYSLTHVGTTIIPPLRGMCRWAKRYQGCERKGGSSAVVNQLESKEKNMCPACMETAAVIVAGAGSTGGILAVCIGKLRKSFTVSSLFQKTKEK